MISRRFNDGPSLERWWVAFSDGDPATRCWWRPLVRSGFRHCMAFRGVTPDACLFLNPLMHRIENGVRLESPGDVLRHCFQLGFRVCVVEIPVSEYDPLLDRGVRRGLGLTCAAVLAYTLGLDFNWRWTPWHLWQALMAAGAEELHEFT